VLKCAFKECKTDGMNVFRGATFTATECESVKNGRHGLYCGSDATARLNDCTMKHNGGDGLAAYRGAVVDLHGSKTDIHSNIDCGISAGDRGNVNIHLPSQHNTAHGNKRDRFQEGGGSIANMNATFSTGIISY
jgi:hypothetical protein